VFGNVLFRLGCLLLLGFVITYGFFSVVFQSRSQSAHVIQDIASTVGIKRHQVIGFLPYWLLTAADKDYPQYLTTLAYFSLTISPDGTIQKFTKPGEAEPGWHALRSGKATPMLTEAKEKGLALSLVLFSAREDSIGELLNNPIPHARTLMTEIAPVMKEHSFTDLNIDIESVAIASESSRQQYTAFISEVKRQLQEQKLGTLTIDASPTDLIKPRLISLKDVAQVIDYVVLMTYDYHYAGSRVTGPVAPIGGAGTESEYDVETGIQKALEVLPKEKVILGAPLYGYEWETIGDSARSAVLPGSGKTASSRRVEDLLSSCAMCSAQIDRVARESYVIYPDSETGTFHQIFYPDQQAMQEKVTIATTYDLSGIALWALGYEGDTVLTPLTSYVQTLQ